MFFPIYYDVQSKTCSLERRSSTDIEIEPKRGDGSEGRWRWGRDRVQKNLALLHAKYSKKKDRWDVAHRVYLNPTLGPYGIDEDEEDDDDDALYERTSKSKSFWTGGDISTDVARREFKKLFPEFTTDEYTKSPYLLRRIIQMAAGPSDLVMDFFAGTGTSAQALFELNEESGASRRYIGVQFPQPIDDAQDAAKAGYSTTSQIAFERIRRAAAKGGGIAFRGFRLAPSSLQRWRGISTQTTESYVSQLEAFTDTLEAGWKAENVIWEVALREGLSLDSKITQIGEAEPVFFRVSDEERTKAFTICLENSLTLDAVMALGLTRDDLFVCRATALDDTLAANLALQCRLKVL